jgi:hypothetical protein
MATVIRNAGLVGINLAGLSREELLGQYLRSYDPEFAHGMGLADWVPNPREARVFPTVSDAILCYRAIPKSQPVNRLGHPNRPLTAYTVEFIHLEDAIREYDAANA